MTDHVNSVNTDQELHPHTLNEAMESIKNDETDEPPNNVGHNAQVSSVCNICRHSF